MAFDDIDTLSLTFDKLQYIFRGYDTILNSFLETNAAYRQGTVSDREFFDKIQESIMRFSALEFLSIKSIFEIKKTLNRGVGTRNITTIEDQSTTNARTTSHSVASFVVAGTLPRSDTQTTIPQTKNKNCIQCGSLIRQNSKFCTNCGNKA